VKSELNRYSINCMLIDEPTFGIISDSEILSFVALWHTKKDDRGAALISKNAQQHIYIPKAILEKHSSVQNSRREKSGPYV
jgi:hypothetical protein